MTKVIEKILHSDGEYSILKMPYETSKGIYIEVIRHETGRTNVVRVRQSPTGKYFLTDRNHWLLDFTKTFRFVPWQIEEVGK